MTPGEVLDGQADLLDRLADPRFGRMIGGLIIDQFRPQDAGLEEVTAKAAGVLRQQVRTAYAYLVTAEMSDLVRLAAAQLDDLDRFDPDLAPTGAGMVAFESPLPVSDIRGRTMLLHWLVWGPGAYVDHASGAEAGMLIWQFNDAWRQPDEVDDWMIAEMSEHYGDERIASELLRVRGRWATIGVQIGFRSERLGPALLGPSKKQIEELAAEGTKGLAATNTLRYLHALFLLLNQTVVTAEPERPERAARRRAERNRLPPAVTVIRLRRIEHPREPGESQVEWRWRWLVRGHWRWQACGPNHPGAVEMAPGRWRARIWIAPYQKGPEDKPLHLSEKVIRLER